MAKGPGNWTDGETPRVRTRDVVIWLWKTSPERFTVDEVSKHFDVARGDAYRRVQYMVVYGMARRLGEVEAHRAGRRRVAYTLTDWGRKYGSDQSKKRK
jgi:predicted transcriptional regulator